jgi:hypothetical protein
MEKRKFMKDAFPITRDYFRAGMLALEKNPHIHGELATETSPPEIAVELFVDGGNKGACRIWLGGAFSENTICYAEGRKLPIVGNSYNDMLSGVDDGGDLSLHALMDVGIRFGGSKLPFDTKHMTADEAAEYLWRRLMAHLEY